MDNKQIVWNYFYPLLNNNAFGVAGLMGNLQQESGNEFCRIQNDFTKDRSKSIQYALEVDGLKKSKDQFCNDGLGWGISQLTFRTRKAGFYDYCKSIKKPAVSIADPTAQLEYLYKELQDYKLVDKLKNSKSIREAAVLILTQFEKPKDQSIAVQNQRTLYGEEIYKQYGGTASSAPTQTPAQQPVAPTIIKQTSSVNTSARSGKIEWIVVHYTAGTTSRKGVAKNTATYFSKGTTKASADYIVDDVEIVQYNLDPVSRYTWAVGGKKYPSKTCSISGQYYGQCKNNNSISIEMCSTKANTKSLSAADDDWSISDAVVQNTVKLVKYLMQLYKIDITHVITHAHVSGKPCPQPWVKNEVALANWYNFLNMVKDGAPALTPVAPTQQQIKEAANAGMNKLYKILADSLNVRSGPGTQYPVVTTVKKGEAFTIVDQKGNWGLLKSYAAQRNGWISLKYAASC